jgi:hypothetical protein
VEQARHRKVSLLDASKMHVLRFVEEADEIVSSSVAHNLIMVNVSYKDPRVNLYSISKFQLLRYVGCAYLI